MKKKIIGIILAAACIIYGISICLADSGSMFFTAWFAIAGVILIETFSDSIRSRLKKRTFIILHRLLRFLELLALIVVIVTWTLIGSCFHTSTADHLDDLIVLGSLVRSDGPSIVTKYRLDAAYEYLSSHPDTICIVSGGQGRNEPAPEAVIMKQYLLEKRIDESRVIAEPDSSNTTENIRNSSALIKERDGAKALSEKKIGIVTSNFHVYRGMMLAKHAGFVHVYGIAAYTTPFFLPNNMLRESCGILKDYLFGNM